MSAAGGGEVSQFWFYIRWRGLAGRRVEANVVAGSSCRD